MLRKIPRIFAALATRKISFDLDLIPLHFEKLPPGKIANWVLTEGSVAIKPGRPWGFPTILQLMSSLACLEYPSSQFEVIVVDDGSKVPFQGVVSDFQKRLNISLVRQPNAGPGAARNRGAQEAGGRFLAFIDDDCRPEPRWLQALSDALHESEWNWLS